MIFHFHSQPRWCATTVLTSGYTSTMLAIDEADNFLITVSQIFSFPFIQLSCKRKRKGCSKGFKGRKPYLKPLSLTANNSQVTRMPRGRKTSQLKALPVYKLQAHIQTPSIYPFSQSPRTPRSSTPRIWTYKKSVRGILLPGGRLPPILRIDVCIKIGKLGFSSY